MAEILFFLSEAKTRVASSASLAGVRESLEIWRPGPFRLKPRGLGLFPFAIWWLFHYARIFRGRGYSVWLVRDGEQIVHRSCVFPRFFRFPFMAARDLQVGDIWTHASRRGQGLSSAVLKRILESFPEASVWFLCEAGNVASVKLAHRAGMKLHGTGRRDARFGIALLGSFVVASGEDV